MKQFQIVQRTAFGRTNFKFQILAVLFTVVCTVGLLAPSKVLAQDDDFGNSGDCNHLDFWGTVTDQNGNLMGGVEVDVYTLPNNGWSQTFSFTPLSLCGNGANWEIGYGGVGYGTSVQVIPPAGWQVLSENPVPIGCSHGCGANFVLCQTGSCPPPFALTATLDCSTNNVNLNWNAGYPPAGYYILYKNSTPYANIFPPTMSYTDSVAGSSFGQVIPYDLHKNNTTEIASTSVTYNCAPPPSFDYNLSRSGGSDGFGNIIVTQGNAGSNTVTRNLVSGTTQGVTLSVSGLPSGATLSPAITNNPCNPTCSSTLSISTLSSTTPGTYLITVTGTASGGLVRTTQFNLIVNSAPSFNYNLTNNGNITVTQGNAGSNTVTRNLVSGTTQGVTLSVSGLPSGATLSPAITNNPCNPTCSSTLSISTLSSTTPGTYLITVTGSPLARTTSFNLVVNAATPGPFNITSVTPSCISGVSSVQINWSASSGASYYIVYHYDVAANTWAAITPANWTSTSWLDQAITPGRSYQYWVRAFNDPAPYTDSNQNQGGVWYPTTPIVALNCAAPIVDLRVGNANFASASNGPITISNGSSSLLTWTSSNTTSCSASGAWATIGPKALNNTTSSTESTGVLTTSRTSTLTCTNSASGLSNFDTVTINVTAALAVTCSVPAVANIGQNVQWSATASGGSDPYSYLWTIGSPTCVNPSSGCTTSQNPQVTYSTAQTVNGTVRVTDSANAQQTSAICSVTIQTPTNAWIQTTGGADTIPGGDVHSDTRISTPGGP